MSHRMPLDKCPACSRLFDAATGIRLDGKPSPDDLTICISCGCVLQFGADLRLRPAPADWSKLLEPEQAAQVLTVQAAIRARGPLPRRERS